MENELLQVLDAFLAEIDESVVPASPQAAYYHQHHQSYGQEPSNYADAFFSDVEDIATDDGMPAMMSIASHDVPNDAQWGMHAPYSMTTPVNAGITQPPDVVWTPPQAVQATTTPIAIKSQAASDSAGSTPSSRPKPMTSRKRQKQELEYLRVKVQELEEELQRLRADELASIIANTTVDDDAHSSDSAGALTTTQDSRAVVIFWKRAALSERKATDAATEENARLKALVEGQLEVAKSLETVLTKRPRLAVSASLHSVAVWLAYVQQCADCVGNCRTRTSCRRRRRQSDRRSHIATALGISLCTAPWVCILMTSSARSMLCWNPVALDRLMWTCTRRRNWSTTAMTSTLSTRSPSW